MTAEQFKAIEELLKICETACEEYNATIDCDVVAPAIRQLIADHSKYEKALKFYADPETYTERHVFTHDGKGSMAFMSTAQKHDRGAIARSALEQKEGV